METLTVTIDGTIREVPTGDIAGFIEQQIKRGTLKAKLRSAFDPREISLLRSSPVMSLPHLFGDRPTGEGVGRAGAVRS